MGALAAGVGMALVGSLMKPKQGPSQTTTTQSTLAPWQESYWQNQVGQAQNLANTPYTAYSGQRVANLTAPQQEGIQNAVANADQWRTPMSGAVSGYQSVMSPFSQDALSPYMSPYLNGVVSNIEREGNENFSAPGGVGDKIESDFTGLGQFGSKRMGDVMARAGELNQRETQGAVANALNTGFNQAENEYNANKAQTLMGAQGLQSAAGATQNLNAGETNALETVGGIQQQNQQQNLDVGYQNYVEGRDWAMNRALAAKNLTAGMPTEGTNVTTQPGAYQTTPFQNFLGGVGAYKQGFFSDLIPNSSDSVPNFSGETNGGFYDQGNVGFGGVGASPYKRGGLALSRGYKSGGFIKRAIKHPGALHRMMGVPQGQKIPAKRLHAAAEKGGVLGRRARFAEELEGFHHADGGYVHPFTIPVDMGPDGSRALFENQLEGIVSNPAREYLKSVGNASSGNDLMAVARQFDPNSQTGFQPTLNGTRYRRGGRAYKRGGLSVLR